MAKIIEAHRNITHSFGSDAEKFQYLETMVHLFRSFEHPLMNDGEINYSLRVLSFPEKKVLYRSSSPKKVARMPRGEVTPFFNFMEDIVCLAGVLDALRSNLPESERFGETLLGYFSHCVENAWAYVADLRADQASEDIGPIESKVKYRKLGEAEAVLEELKDKYFKIILPKIQRIAGKYDSSRIIEELNFEVLI